MKERTREALAQLDGVEWFRNVGQKDTEAAIVLSSWPKAVASCASVEWENLCLEAVNQYREKLDSRSRERFQQWNEVVTDLKTVTTPLVQHKVERVVHDHDLPQVFEDTVRWNILGLAVEGEYSDIVAPGYYAGLAYWYMAGHFPCGWQGSYPEGKLIVY